MKSDQQLQQDVRAELLWDSSLHAAHLGVAVKDGVVTLSGEVGDPAEKWRALHAAQHIAGVQALTSAITVRMPSWSHRSDADIAAAVDHRLAWHAALPGAPLDVVVDKGWVTLSGHVKWQYQREAAVDCVRRLMGVQGVHNRIRLQPGESEGLTTWGLHAALERAAGLDADQIQVRVEGDRVTLEGTVRHWAGRQAALAAAWATPGIRKVRDEMMLAL